MKYNVSQTLLGFTRIAFGWIFLWPFLDKVFGLGFATEFGKGWIHGNSPTYGFLTYGVRGPFKEVFQSLAGLPPVDWLFMGGLLFIGLSLLFGYGVYVAAYSGAAMLFFMWLALLPPEHNPFIDDHIIYAITLITLAHLQAGRYFGIGEVWSKNPIVKNIPALK